MRTAILVLAVLGLAAGCGGDAPAPAPAARPAADPALERVVEDWPLPAMMPGSALPDLVPAGNGRLLLSWTNAPPGRRPALQFSSYDAGAARWETAPTTIAVGASMVVNWADTPHIMATGDGALWVHWLQKDGDAPHAYDVVLAASRDGGRNWSEPVRPHAAGTGAEHGFVSLWPDPDGGLGIAWLEGRGPAGGMALRATRFDAGLRGAPAVEVDAPVCDCCQTGAAVTARGPLLVYRGRTADEVRDIMATRFEDGAWTSPRPVHADGWVMPACPVNGPSVAAAGEAVVAGWYTAAAGQAEVRVAASVDAGDSFSAPVVVDAGDALLGRVSVALGDGQAWVLWLREEAEGQSLWLSRRSTDLATEYQRLRVASLAGRGRGTGVPQLALAGGVAHVVWTDVVDGVPGLHGARIVPR